MDSLRQRIERRPLAWAYGLFVALAALGRPASYAAPPAGDLGQYMYMGTTLTEGGTPYLDAASNKGPLAFVWYALMRQLAGHSALVVRIVLVLVAGLAALALAAYIARWAGRGAGLLAGVTYALLSSSFEFEGWDPSLYQFGVAPMLGAWWMATRGGSRAALGAGALTAVAFWMNAAFGLVAPFVAWELWRAGKPRGRGRRFALAAGGAAAVSAPLLLWIGLAGAIDDMVVQVFGKVQQTLVPGSTAERIPGGAQDAPLQWILDLPEPGLWIAGLIGCAVGCMDPRLRRAAIPAALWIVVSWLRVELAGYAFPNQYVLALPGISAGLALGIAAVWPSRASARVALAGLVLAAPLWSAVVAPQLRQLGIPAEARGPAIAEQVADFVRKSTVPDSHLVVAEYDPQIYWLADRPAASRFFDSFGLSGRDDYVAERRRDLFRRPPAAIAALPERLIDPDLSALLDQGRYRLEFDREGARVWLYR